MARKSRKNIAPVIKNDLENKVYNTALYIRLSIEDNKKRGNSIKTQTDILNNFAALNGDIKIIDTYIDNGTTGTNFERPQFKRMISDIENKKINCVIVKDLSRLGRNAIDTGFYIEKYFPIHNVRFISVNDDFDTNKENENGGIILPLKNMINEAYSIDIGRKIKAQARQSMKMGEYIGSKPPYGYIKSPDNCHKLIIDEESAAVVKQIFLWKYEGISYNQIVKRLNESNILPPNKYSQNKGIINHKNLRGSGYWDNRAIKRILSNEIYTGDMVQGKTQTINHKQVSMPKEFWITVKNTHEPIISHEIFNAVNNICKEISDKYKNIPISQYTPNILKGKIFCGHCGRNLNRHKDKKNKKYGFRCLSNERIAKNVCLPVSVNEEYVLKYIIDYLKENYGIVLENKQELRKNIMSKDNKCSYEHKILKLKQDLRKNQVFLKSLYESLVNQIITNDEYLNMKQEYENRITDILKEMENLENKQKSLNKKFEIYSDTEKLITEISNTNLLTAELIQKLIDKILVYSDKRIEVFLRFDNIRKGANV